MRLIDADALIEFIVEEAQDLRTLSTKTVGQAISKTPTIDAVPVIRCKECRYFETDHWEKVNEIPIIVAHEICTRWSNGCKTSENGYCFMAERKEE